MSTPTIPKFSPGEAVNQENGLIHGVSAQELQILGEQCFDARERAYCKYYFHTDIIGFGHGKSLTFVYKKWVRDRNSYIPTESENQVPTPSSASAPPSSSTPRTLPPHLQPTSSRAQT